jgi:hypothetical protein
MEQRVNIKFCVKMGKTQTETYDIFQTVYGDESLSSSNLKMGVRIFGTVQQVGVLQLLKMQA